MAMEHVTALGAMSALRGQIEERLLQNDDFRALRALDRAIADLQIPARAVGLAAHHALPVGGVPTAQSMMMPSASVADTQATLQQKITAKFSGSAA